MDFDKKSLKKLSNKFNIIYKKELNQKNIKKIVSIILPMDKFYPEIFFSKFKNLRSIVTPTTGDIHLDKRYLDKKKIKIFNLFNEKKKLNKITSTSELALGLILNITRKITFAHDNFKKLLKFTKYDDLLSCKKFSLGIIGMGRIGTHLAHRANALGFKVSYYDPFINIKKFKKYNSLIKLAKNSNIISINMHYKPNLKEFFDKKFFSKIKKPSYLINTSRGELINEKDLIKCLKMKILNGAAIDVLKDEYTLKFRKNIKLNLLIRFYLKNKKQNLYITPKQGGSNLSAWKFTENLLIDRLIKYEKNKI